MMIPQELSAPHSVLPLAGPAPIIMILCIGVPCMDRPIKQVIAE